MYLITGGAGFIGSNLVDYFIKQNKKIVVVDNLVTGKKENLKDYLSSIEFIEGDIADYSLIESIIKKYKIKFILHQAALPSVPRSIKNPLKTNESIIQGTLNIFYASKENKVEKVVYASSSSVYGDTPTLPKIENQKANPKSPYAVSKLTTEYYGKIFYDIYGLPNAGLRYFNVFGPNQDPLSEYAAVIPKFITSILKDKAPTIYGDGEQSRDFTYIDNVIQANVKALESDKINGKFINVATGKRYTLNDLVDFINKILNKNIKPIYADERIGDVKHSLASIDLAKELIDYNPEIYFEKGLENTINYFKNL